MRILYFSMNCSVHDRRFLASFVKYGVYVGFLTLETQKVPCEDLAGVKYLGSLDVQANANAKDLMDAIPLFTRILHQFEPDLILAGPLHNCGFIVGVSNANLPFVAQSWAFDLLWEARRDHDSRYRTRVALEAATAWFLDSNALLQECQSLTGLSIPANFVMPWGLESIDMYSRNKHRDSLRRQLGIEAYTILLCTRNMEEIYGTKILLEAFRLAHKQNRNLRLFWAGDGSLRCIVDNFIEAHKLNESVELLGLLKHDHLLNFFAVADFYVSCSASDGTSISLLEAMASGLPVVVSDIPGNRELVRHNDNGWLAKHESASEFAATMLEATSASHERLQQMIQKNLVLVQTKADWSRNFFFFLRFLKQCM
ncbi:glycosyltransferase family 4 protein [Candidatus Chloroploca asiatica]|uniref:Glycosyl transferase family 1 domain-containing protein n=1 Tax=Candidatus Chloroploca asiatica TaxID=1506545 RepID=A0A2H3L547_9CHLR|nr:glycosyltransferase family 4 protein [Candidatus Chloroploca asiatica]PDV99985.1 hypothetical protein A9Q02_11160 [Candidatus Chloroploca asiatica]